MVNETKKILDPAIQVAPTAVRVPVFNSHSEALTIETEKKLSVADARKLLAQAPGIIVMDDPAALVYATPRETSGQDATFVSRIREDVSCHHGLQMWVVSDNLRKGAALNAVQIAEVLIHQYL